MRVRAGGEADRRHNTTSPARERQTGRKDRSGISKWVSSTHQTVAGGAGVWGEGLPMTIRLAIVAAA